MNTVNKTPQSGIGSAFIFRLASTALCSYIMKQIHIIYHEYYIYTIISVILPHLQPDVHGCILFMDI